MHTPAKRIYLSPPHLSGLEQQYVMEAFETNWIAPLGPNVDNFEQEMAEYAGTAGAVALSSGTAAIHLALRCLGVGPGDLVFCSSLTFVASANPICYLGAEPAFIDSEPESWNMSPDALKQAFTASEQIGRFPKAVIVVNLYGQSADMEPIKAICDHYGVPVVEDAAESLGSTYRGRMSGSLGKFGIYSFNGNKIITTSGGGMLVSDDLQALDKARFWASQAREPAKHYQHREQGYNYRLSNVLAGIGRGQLRILEERVRARRRIFERYTEYLSRLEGLHFMKEMHWGRANRWLTVLLIDEAEAGVSAGRLINALEGRNIESRPVWKPLHMQPLYEGASFYAHSESDYVSERLFRQGICLPSGSSMSDEEQNYVISCLKECLQEKRDANVRIPAS